jgi:hypothetical protein
MRDLMLLLLFLTGCGGRTAQPHHLPPQQTTVRLPLPPDVAYQRAYTTFAKLPTATVTSANSQTRTFGGEWHHAVQMSIVVEAQGSGALVTISGHIPPMRQVTGQFTEVFDYAKLLEENP